MLNNGSAASSGAPRWCVRLATDVWGAKDKRFGAGSMACGAP